MNSLPQETAYRGTTPQGCLDSALPGHTAWRMKRMSSALRPDPLRRLASQRALLWERLQPRRPAAGPWLQLARRAIANEFAPTSNRPPHHTTGAT